MLSSFSCLGIGASAVEEARGSGLRDSEVGKIDCIESHIYIYTSMKEPDGAEFPSGVLRNFACIAKTTNRDSPPTSKRMNNDERFVRYETGESLVPFSVIPTERILQNETIIKRN